MHCNKINNLLIPIGGLNFFLIYTWKAWIPQYIPVLIVLVSQSLNKAFLASDRKNQHKVLMFFFLLKFSELFKWNYGKHRGNSKWMEYQWTACAPITFSSLCRKIPYACIEAKQKRNLKVNRLTRKQCALLISWSRTLQKTQIGKFCIIQTQIDTNNRNKMAIAKEWTL